MITEQDKYIGNREDIEPCFNPHCCSNGRNIYIHTGFDYVWCESCGSRGPMFDGHPEDAISSWNELKR